MECEQDVEDVFLVGDASFVALAMSVDEMTVDPLGYERDANTPHWSLFTFRNSISPKYLYHWYIVLFQCEVYISMFNLFW